MDWLFYVLSAVIGYFIGNIQTAVILSHLRFKSDIRRMGSGNAGATNMLRVYGLKSGLITFFGDLLKTVIAILLAWFIGGDRSEICGYIAALAVVLGHNFPVIFGFHGGKGIACTVAIMWMISPFPEALAATVIGLILIGLTRIMSLSVLIALLLYVVAMIVLHVENIPLIVLCICLLLLACIRHIDNIKRIIKGTENRLSFHKSNKSNKNKNQNRNQQAGTQANQ